MLIGLVILIIWVLFWILWAVFAVLTSQRNELAKYITAYLFVILFIISIGYFMSYFSSDMGFLKYHFLPNVFILYIIGFLLMISGLGFAICARAYLSKSWRGDVSLNQAHKLIQSGPYKYIRHPIYTGMMFGLVGTVLVLGEIWVVIMLFVSCFALVLKSRSEEKLLISRFSEYGQYIAKSKSFLPFLF